MVKGSEGVAVIVTAILLAIGILGICFADAIAGIRKYKRYVRNKYNKKG